MIERGKLELARRALEEIAGPPVTLRPVAQHYLVMTRGHREGEAIDSFRRHGCRAYWPNYQELGPSRRMANGLATRTLRRVGIIPGYVFVAANVSITEMLEVVVGTIAVVRRLDGKPLLIDDDDVQLIKRIEVGLNTPKQVEPICPDFKKGEKVRFRDDLEGRWPAGRIIRIATQGRIVVEVDAMGRATQVVVGAHQIERTQVSPARQDSNPRPSTAVR